MAGLYIHIPFCRSKCAYCDFYSVASRSLDATRFVDSLIAELGARADQFSSPFDTVYIGGGTPSVLPAEEITRLLGAALSVARPEAEVTVEVNPDDITPEYASTISSAGVNRVSMGVQSLIDSELKAISRRHDSLSALQAIDLLRAAGINNMSCDLIYGLPGQTLESFSQSIVLLLTKRPEHISAYLLSYEPGTRLTRDLEAGRISQATDTEAESYYSILCASLAAAGYEHYEISNFALPGRRSRHNSSYWDPANPYLGLGPSAHSYDGHNHRSANVSSIRQYLDHPTEATAMTETLTEAQRFDEQLMLGLRTADGIDTTRLEPTLRNTMLRRANRWIRRGDLILANDTLTIPESSWLITDTILADLFAD